MTKDSLREWLKDELDWTQQELEDDDTNEYVIGYRDSLRLLKTHFLDDTLEPQGD